MTTHEGACECGAVRYRLADDPITVNCCHCRDCQRITGSAFALNGMIETERIAVLTGEPEERALERDDIGGTRAWRCPTCEALLWADHPMFGDMIRFVRMGTLDHADTLAPDAHYFIRSRHSWVTISADVPQFETLPEQGAGATLPEARAARLRDVMARVDASRDPRNR